jgi:hypothetical protein
MTFNFETCCGKVELDYTTRISLACEISAARPLTSRGETTIGDNIFSIENDRTLQCFLSCRMTTQTTNAVVSSRPRNSIVVHRSTLHCLKKVSK